MGQMVRFLFLTIAWLAFLTACGPSSGSLSPSPTRSLLSTSTFEPTLTPSTTAVSSPSLESASPTPENTPTLESTKTINPTITSTAPPLPTPYLTPTSAPTSLPQPQVDSGAIQIFAPGPLSKLVSPVEIFGYAIPGYNNLGQVILYGEDGRTLASEMLQLNTAYTWAYFSWSLPFQIQAAGELARLSLSTQDQYGRLTALYSVHLILLQEGYSIVNPPGDLRERGVILQPAAGQRNAGGLLRVSGELRPLNSQPLVVELVTRDGNIIASQLVPITPPPTDIYIPFQVDLPYSVSRGTWALLEIHQPDARIGGIMYLNSREIYLNP
jgi:hypothetical protein